MSGQWMVIGLFLTVEIMIIGFAIVTGVTYAH